MDNKFNTQQYINRHGFYMVGNKKFFNKTLALLESSTSKLPVEWKFNHDAYGKIDWTVPIETNLEELYRLRAQQLRNQYDYLILHFSGGADSTNVLHAFVRNNIFLDEIVMQYPKAHDQVANGVDYSGNNQYSEIPFSAIPILNDLKHLISPKTLIKFQDLSESATEAYKHDNWFELLPLGTNIAVTGAARQRAQHTDLNVLKLCNKGMHVAQILGIDKPFVHFNGEDYYAHFSDTAATHTPPADMNRAMDHDNYYHCEFFYWTPDMPEIVVKQAQEIKRYAEMVPAIKYQISNHMHVEKMREVLHPVIYPAYVKLPFVTGKISVAQIKRTADNWFWQTASDTIQHNYLEAIEYLNQNIDSLYFNGNNIYSGGFTNLFSEYYRL